MSKQEFCVNSLVAKIIKDYVMGDFEKLIEEIKFFGPYGRFQCKLVKDINSTETDSKFRSVMKVLFVNQDSVILQDVELSGDCTRFGTYKVLLEDWSKVFQEWEDADACDGWLELCWTAGMRMYGANV